MARSAGGIRLGPFNNPFGMGASPVLAGNTLLMNCDSETGSFMLAVDKDTGEAKMARRASRRHPRFLHAAALPAARRALAGAGDRLVSPDGLRGGERRDRLVGRWLDVATKAHSGAWAKDTIYVLGWAGGADTGQQENVPPFEEVLKSWDKNHDGKLSQDEIPGSEDHQGLGRNRSG